MDNKTTGAVSDKPWKVFMGNADETINLCVNEKSSDADVYEALMVVIRGIRESKSSSANAKQMKSSFDDAHYISSSLRKEARKKKALRYYYFGMYQAKLEQLYDEFLYARSISNHQAVESRKYFSQIMKILYSQEVVRQCDLAKALHVERANLSREMSLLVLAGLVEERKTSKLKLYNLSARGYDYCNKFHIANAACLEAIGDAPVNAESVKHGRWIKVHEWCGVEVLKCSACGREHPRLPTAYCCDCGAKMDQE